MEQFFAFLNSLPKLMEMFEKIYASIEKLGAERIHSAIDDAYKKTMNANTDEELRDAAKAWANVVASLPRK